MGNDTHRCPPWRTGRDSFATTRKWGKVLDGRIERLIKAVEQAVRKAKELKEKPDENHIDS